jgi:methyltransferase-like protein 23
VFTDADEQRFLGETTGRPPYGVVLWPAAVALAHEVAARADEFGNTRVLELGAGTGLPGIIAASFGARVVQTDRHDAAMMVCKENGARNAVSTIEYRAADWEHWTDTSSYDWIIGSDVLYAERQHPNIQRILESNLAPGGRALFSDPFRPFSIRFLEALEPRGWSIRVSKWSVGVDSEPRAIGVYELRAGA